MYLQNVNIRLVSTFLSSVGLCKNYTVGETWYEKTYYLKSLILLFVPSESSKKDNISHTTLVNWVIILLKCTDNEHFQNLMFSNILLKIFLSNSGMQKSNRECIIEWNYIVTSVGFWHISDFFLSLPVSYNNLCWNAVLTKNHC